jgi:hypothetical protein
MKTSIAAIATHLGMDNSEVREYRYHTGRTSLPVWSVDDSYYCVTKGTQKPAVHRDGMEFNWIKVKDNYVELDGWQVWKSS